MLTDISALAELGKLVNLTTLDLWLYHINSIPSGSTKMLTDITALA
jgi:hypothetical protein